jgi:hypothetical protein
MCYSAPVSLAAFIIGTIFSYLLYLENDISYKIIGLFLAFVVLMQLIEFLLWTHQFCNLYNKSISFVGMILNYLQPLAMGLLILYFYKKMPQLNKKIVIAILVIYTILAILYMIQFMFLKNKCSHKKDNPYLLWNWGQMKNSGWINTIYLIALISIIYIGMPDKFTAIMSIIIGGFALIMSYLFYPRPFIGAIWCLFTAFIPVILYLYKKFIDIK